MERTFEQLIRDGIDAVDADDQTHIDPEFTLRVLCDNHNSLDISITRNGADGTVDLSIKGNEVTPYKED